MENPFIRIRDSGKALLCCGSLLLSLLLIAACDGNATRVSQNSSQTVASIPHAYSSTDNDYLNAIRLQREIERESGSRGIYLYNHRAAKLPGEYDQQRLLSRAWRARYPGIVDSDADGLCETYDGDDRTLREQGSGQLVKRFVSTRDAAEFLTAQIINEYHQQKIGDTSACQFKNPGEVTQFLAYFDLNWLVGYSKARRISLQTRNLIEWIPAKVLSTYQFLERNSMPMCSAIDRKRHAHMYMLSHYLWRAHVPMRVDYSWSKSLDELVQQLRFNRRDAWSYATTEMNFSNNDTRLGPDNGLWLSVPDSAAPEQIVMLVEPGSAAEQAGLRRGDKVLAVNGYATHELTTPSQRRSLREEMVRQGVGQYRVIKQGMVQPQDVQINYPQKLRNTIHHKTVLPWQGKQVGYLNIKEFHSFTREELNAAFADFANQGVSELILDLRYNLGGDTFASAHLASLLVGKDDAVYSSSRLADPAWSMPIQYMDAYPNTINVDRVVVLTSEMTASAGEQLINALTPYMDVITVGSRTYGKPVTMVGKPICDDLVFVASAMSLNAKSEPVPFAGIEPTCPVQDSLLTAPHDVDNPPMRTALNYLHTNTCQ